MSKSPSDECVNSGRSPRKHTVEFKKQAVAMVTQQGVSIAEAARRLGVHENQLRRWKKKAAGRRYACQPGSAHRDGSGADSSAGRE